jgi:hypothetical protein
MRSSVRCIPFGTEKDINQLDFGLLVVNYNIIIRNVKAIQGICPKTGG